MQTGVELKHKINNLYHVSFTITIFWLLMVEKFFEKYNFTFDKNEVILGLGGLVILYVICYLQFLYSEAKLSKCGSKLTSGFLQVNLVILGLSVLFFSQSGKIDRLNNIFEILLIDIFYVLILLMLIIPLLLLFFFQISYDKSD